LRSDYYFLSFYKLKKNVVI